MLSKMKFIFVYITNPNKEIAKKIAKELLENRLIACANLYSIDSLYWWKNKIVDEPEIVLIGKTTEDKYSEVKAYIEDNHPYSVPCIIQIPINRINDGYKDWLLGELN